MISFRCVNAHEALPVLLDYLRREGVARPSRYGDVLQIPEPVSVEFLEPTQRVLFHPWRDANPFLHFYESLWMLAGREDVEPVARYAKRMREFSDDGKKFNAAYGHRWREMKSWYAEHTSEDGTEHEQFSMPRDQLKVIVDALRANKDDRQQVLQIWDHDRDLGTKTKDHACNLIATFQVGVKGRVDMVVFNRSNDLVWGMLGANVVHFSMLHEYVARHAGYPVGTYTQVSANLHGYVKTAGPMIEHWNDGCPDPYENEPVYPAAIVQAYTTQEQWDDDCRRFVTDSGRLPPDPIQFHDPFFQEVAWPIVRAHDILKDRPDDPQRFEYARNALLMCGASDWRLACVEWINRREQRRTAS